jgi:hypothetical protein
MSRLALAKSQNAKVRSLARRILKAQTAEIADFQRLLQSGNLTAAAASHPMHIAATAMSHRCPACAR